MPSGSLTTQIGPDEAAFIAARDSFYLASIGENSWPYTQYRRGSKGFLRVIDSTTLAFADFHGNRQHISTGVVPSIWRTCLFLIDSSSRRRLKIWAETEISKDPAMTEKRTASYGATIDRTFLFHVLAFEWNCQQHCVQHAAGAAEVGQPFRQARPHPSSAMTSAHSRRAA
jgi:predicted pyridoxine 5'-phosphate oxidase superfamily flavin-nucleotide-binding protein